MYRFIRNVDISSLCNAVLKDDVIKAARDNDVNWTKRGNQDGVGPVDKKPYFYEARESSVVPEEFLTAQLRLKLYIY